MNTIHKTISFSDLSKEDKDMINQVYYLVDVACQSGNTYCLIGCTLSDDVQQFLKGSGFHVQKIRGLSYFDYKVSWTKPSFFQRVKSKILGLFQ